MVHKNFHETVCSSAPFWVVSWYTFLFVWTTNSGDENKKKAMPLTQLLFYSVTLCYVLLTPVSCFLSNDRLFLKLFFCPLTTDSVIAHIFTFYFFVLLIWCFCIIFSLQFLHQRALCSGRPLSMWSTSPVILRLVALILMLPLLKKKHLVSNDMRSLMFERLALGLPSHLLPLFSLAQLS